MRPQSEEIDEGFAKKVHAVEIGVGLLDGVVKRRSRGWCMTVRKAPGVGGSSSPSAASREPVDGLAGEVEALLGKIEVVVQRGHLVVGLCFG